MIYVLYDTETTGLKSLQVPLNKPASIHKAGSEVIQIGGLVLDDSLVPVRAFCHYCDCIAPHSDADAYRVHGIDLTAIRKEIPGVFLEDVIVRHIPELLLPDMTIIGYNCEFDIKMVAQSIRSSGLPFSPGKRVVSRLPREGRWYLDVMDFLPQRNKLTSYASQLTKARDSFYRSFAGRIPLETNMPTLFLEQWEHAHNAVYDAIETYLLFVDRVYGQKVFKGGVWNGK